MFWDVLSIFGTSRPGGQYGNRQVSVCCSPTWAGAMVSSWPVESRASKISENSLNRYDHYVTDVTFCMILCGWKTILWRFNHNVNDFNPHDAFYAVKPVALRDSPPRLGLKLLRSQFHAVSHRFPVDDLPFSSGFTWIDFEWFPAIFQLFSSYALVRILQNSSEVRGCGDRLGTGTQLHGEGRDLPGSNDFFSQSPWMRRMKKVGAWWSNFWYATNNLKWLC